MANKTILMSKIRQILRSFTQGKSKVQISEQSGASRNTVKKYIRKFLTQKMTFDMLNSLSDAELEVLFGSVEPADKGERYEQLQRMLPDLEKRFKQKGVTIDMLWRLYRQTHTDGFGHTQFHTHFTAYTGRAKAVMHMEHKASDKMYIDFAGEKLSITDKETGEVQPVEVFIALLGCSQLTYVEAVSTQ